MSAPFPVEPPTQSWRAHCCGNLLCTPKSWAQCCVKEGEGGQWGVTLVCQKLKASALTYLLPLRCLHICRAEQFRVNMWFVKLILLKILGHIQYCIGRSAGFQTKVALRLGILFWDTYITGLMSTHTIQTGHNTHTILDWIQYWPAGLPYPSTKCVGGDALVSYCLIVGKIKLGRLRFQSSYTF